MNQNEDVQLKAEAVQRWCQAATKHELTHGGKPWSYLLVPHSEIKPSTTLGWLIDRFSS